MPERFSFRALERGQAGGLHQTFVAQLSCALDVDRAPNASPSSWRKSNGVAQIIDALRIPSIQPKQSASSTDSGQVMLGWRELFL